MDLILKWFILCVCVFVCVRRNVFCHSLKRFKMEVNVAIKINYLYCTHLRRKIIRFYDIAFCLTRVKELFHRQINFNLFQYLKLMTILKRKPKRKNLPKPNFSSHLSAAHTFWLIINKSNKQTNEHKQMRRHGKYIHKVFTYFTKLLRDFVLCQSIKKFRFELSQFYVLKK